MGEHQSSGFVLQGLKELPIQVPLEILEAQSVIGVNAVMLWINLLSLVQKQEPINLSSLQEFMKLDMAEINKALVLLADYGWVNDEGYEIKLCIPISTPDQGAALPQKPDDLLDHGQKCFEWLVNLWSNRVAPPTPSEMKKLFFWMEKKQLSHEVIAVAIEEMCATVANPHFAYLEGILRNWVNEGVYTYQQLQEKPYLASVLSNETAVTLDPEAERKWKELFPYEFDE